MINTKDCWYHLGATSVVRGKFPYGNVNGVLAHRIMYELYKGPIPKGYDIDHLCKVTKCVNPKHLEAVTHKENCLRGDKTIKVGQSCIRGHIGHFKIRKEGWKRCLTCMKDDNNK